jgi:5'-nucleotidase
MGMNVLLETSPHMIISGINKGSNAGRTVLYSGTVGAVIEGTLKGIPGIAFSFCDDEEIVNPTVTKQYIFPLIQYLLQNPLPFGTFLNVSFPRNCSQNVKGFRLASQGNGYWIENPEKRLHPEGVPYYWLGGKWNSIEEKVCSDVALLEQGYITAVPIHIAHLTDLEVLQTRKESVEQWMNTPSRENSSPRI